MFRDFTDDVFTDDGASAIHQWLGTLLRGTDEDVIQVALDGSTSTAGYMSYAGVFAGERTWVAFSELWSRKLKAHDLEYLRMTDAMGFHGVFGRKRTEWAADAEQRRDEVLADFASVFRELDLRATGFAISVEGLAEEKLVWRKRELFQKVVQEFLGKLPQASKSIIGLICDTEQDAADYFRKWLNNLQQRDETSRRIALLCFGNSKLIHALQLADMMAYLLREEAERFELRPEQAVNPLLSGMAPIVIGEPQWKGQRIILGPDPDE